jgi:hypothetical protein
LIYALVVISIGSFAGMIYNWDFLGAVAFAILPVIVILGIGVLVSASIRSSRGALFAFLGITAGLAGLLGANNLLIQLASGKRSFVLDFASQILIALVRVLQWFSPFEYLMKGLNTASWLEGITLVLAAFFLTAVTALAAILMLRRRTVVP